MPALLYCRTGPMSGLSFSLDAETTVGRTAENAVKLSDDRISSRHARIWPDPESGAWMLEDLDSSNGTLVDGASAAEPVALGDLSIVTFAGRFDFIFQATASSSVSAPADRPASRPSDDIATRAGGAPPSLPETGTADDDDGIRTKVGDAAPSLPDVSAEAGDDEDVRTRLGGAAPSLPDITSTGPDEDVRTQLGGAAPDLPDTGTSEGDDGTQTRPGGAPPTLPDVPGGAESTAGREAETVGPGTPKSPGTGSITLHLRSSEKDLTEFDLREGENVIGRSSDADIRIDDASLSRSHAVITVADGRITVRDDGSKNGTWIDGEKVSVPRVLTPDNRLRFGFRIEAWVSQD